MSWTVHYELRRDRGLTDEERARLERYASKAGGGWEAEPFKLWFSDAPRSAHGFTKLPDPPSGDIYRLFAVLNQLRELVAGAELVVSDDVDSIEWNENWSSYGFVGAVRGVIGTEVETMPPVLDVAWPELWLEVNADWPGSVFLTLHASGENLGVGTVELTRIGVALVDADGVVLYRSDHPAWRKITTHPRDRGYGLSFVPADVWTRVAAVEVHGQLRRTFAEKLLVSSVPRISRAKSAWEVSAQKLASGRKRLCTDVMLSTEFHASADRFWFEASIEVELRMPVVNHLELHVAIFDAGGEALHSFSRPVDTGGPHVVASVGDYVPRLDEGAHVELHARGRIERSGHLATLHLRHRR